MKGSMIADNLMVLSLLFWGLWAALAVISMMLAWRWWKRRPPTK